jgi:hypothetical protein
LNMYKDIVFRSPLISVPAHKRLLKPTQMRANTKTLQRKPLTAQYVSRLLSIYKPEHPDPVICIQRVLEGVQEECQKIQEDKRGWHVSNNCMRTWMLLSQMNSKRFVNLWSLLPQTPHSDEETPSPIWVIFSYPAYLLIWPHTWMNCEISSKTHSATWNMHSGGCKRE